jgi:hypothetical protein
LIKAFGKKNLNTFAAIAVEQRAFSTKKSLKVHLLGFCPVVARLALEGINRRGAYRRW